MDITVHSLDYDRLREIIDLHVPLADQPNLDGEVLLTLMGLYNIRHSVRRNANRVNARELSDTLEPLTLALNNNESTCAICIEVFVKGDEVIRLDCGHMYHHKCVAEWVKYRPTCPMCVTDIPTK